GWRSGTPIGRPRGAPPAASVRAGAQDCAAWSLWVSDACAPSTYQPVCMLTLRASQIKLSAHLAPVLRRYLQNPCFGRFLGQLSRSDALHEVSNHVRLLTALVRSSPISRQQWSVLKPKTPM